MFFLYFSKDTHKHTDEIRSWNTQFDRLTIAGVEVMSTHQTMSYKHTKKTPSNGVFKTIYKCPFGFSGRLFKESEKRRKQKIESDETNDRDGRERGKGKDQL